MYVCIYIYNIFWVPTNKLYVIMSLVYTTKRLKHNSLFESGDPCHVLWVWRWNYQGRININFILNMKK